MVAPELLLLLLIQYRLTSVASVNPRDGMKIWVIAQCFISAGVFFNDVLTLRKKCPYLELFWSAFSRIRTECGEIRSISPYSVRMRENADQNNSGYRHFSRSVSDLDFNLACVILKASY